MNLLDRYIFKSTLYACAAAIGIFGFVIALVNAIRDLIGPGLAGQISVAAFGRLLFLLVPFVISYALPIGILTGVLLLLGRLSADSEITAMRAAGISLPRIARPVLILGVLGVIGGLVINFRSMPWARMQYDQELNAAIRANPLNLIVPKTFIRNFPNVVAYVGEKKGTSVKDIWIWQLDSGKRVTRFIRAASGRVDYDDAANEFIVTLTQAQVETRSGKDPENFTESQPVATSEELEPMHLPLSDLFGRPSVRQKLPWMTYAELQHERVRRAELSPGPANAERRAQDEMQVSVTIQDKINTALAVLAFAIIGVPLGIKVSRRETSANLAVAVLFALGHYFLTKMIGWLDHYPAYRPDLLLWLPNLIFIGVGIWLFRRIDRR